MVTRRLRVGLLGAGTSLVLLGACGLPSGGQAQRVAPADVPYGLLETSPSVTAATAPNSSPGSSSPGTVYLVDDAQLLVPLTVQVDDATLLPLVQSLLNRLAVGPTDRERARGLLTDLGPGASLTVRSIRDGTAYIEVQAAVQAPSPGRLPIAIGQVVLTATSVVGVDRVSFVLSDGTTASVPAPPAGDSTATPLTAPDYASLLAPGQPPPAGTEPLPASTDPTATPSATPTPPTS